MTDTPADPPTSPPKQAPTATPTPPPASSLRRRVRGGLVLGVLTGLLGFAIAVQVHANSAGDNLASLREDDLISIIDNQDSRADQLRQQIATLQQTLQQLQDSGNRSAAAQQQARAEADALGILLGTLRATGPGIIATITDPRAALTAEDLLDVVEELRGAGAEAIDFSGVRVSTSTAFTTVGGAVAVGGTVVHPPYRVTAIGDAKTLDTALNIPGGVAATVRSDGGDVTVSEQTSVTIVSVRSLPPSGYLKPAH